MEHSIRDNKKRGSVFEFLKENIKDESELSIVSAYFTIYAYQNLKKELDNSKKVRFLFGEPSFIRDSTIKSYKSFKVDEDSNSISLKNEIKQKSIALECSKWIREKVELKSMIKPNFLHGKFYHIKNKVGESSSIIGSSNFTVNGLGINKNPNIELNLVLRDIRDQKELLSWFNEVWKDKKLVEDVKEEVLRYLGELYQENSSEFVYYLTLKYLLEKKDEDLLLNEKTGFYNSQIWNALYDFQKDATKTIINKILKYNGGIIADSVGLGKTYEALAVIKYFESLNLRVLVLVPKKLRDNWNSFRGNQSLNPFPIDNFRYDLLSHTDLSREVGESDGISLNTINWGNYDLIVIDESHNFRNLGKDKFDKDGNLKKKSRYNKLLEDLIQEGVDTKVLLLSATPVNNSLRDLRNQINLITKGENNYFKESMNIDDIELTLNNAQKEFTKWSKPKKKKDTHPLESKHLDSEPLPKGELFKKRDINTLIEKLGTDFFKVLDELTIARSRRHIKEFYDIKDVGEFPQKLKPISITSDIDKDGHFSSFEEISEKIENYKLSLFTPSKYVKDEFKNLYEEYGKSSFHTFTQSDREHGIIKMIKVGFLKRLESSIRSFEYSMNRTIEKIDDLIEKIKEFQKKIKNNNQDEIIELETLDFIKGEEDFIKENEDILVGKKLKFNLAHIDLEVWLKDLNDDRRQLDELETKAILITPHRDAKLLDLKEIIINKIENSINKNNKKILIFTAFSDTAKYIYESLVKWSEKEGIALNFALVTGSKKNETTYLNEKYRNQTGFNEILTNFSPISKNRKNMPYMPQEGEIDILIATDCISEGQNLQDCDYVINYDIHWNPVKIIQRFGRIDRIGSKNTKIQLVNFWPTKDLDIYLNLIDRVESKMAIVNLTATEEGNLLSEENDVKEENKFRKKQLKRLKKEVFDLEDIEDNISLTDFTLSDFRADLNNFEKKNKKLPQGVYALIPSPVAEYKNLKNYDYISENLKKFIEPGIIFCLKNKKSKLSKKQKKKLNPLEPYYLSYVNNKGQVKLNYTNSKKILEIYKALTEKSDKPYEYLVDLFNDKTENGKKMEKYSSLLNESISDISNSLNKRDMVQALTQRGGKLRNLEEHIGKDADFELISWLIIE